MRKEIPGEISISGLSCYQVPQQTSTGLADYHLLHCMSSEKWCCIFCVAAYQFKCFVNGKFTECFHFSVLWLFVYGACTPSFVAYQLCFICKCWLLGSVERYVLQFSGSHVSMWCLGIWHRMLGSVEGCVLKCGKQFTGISCQYVMFRNLMDSPPPPPNSPHRLCFACLSVHNRFRPLIVVFCWFRWVLCLLCSHQRHWGSSSWQRKKWVCLRF